MLMPVIVVVLMKRCKRTYINSVPRNQIQSDRTRTSLHPVSLRFYIQFNSKTLPTVAIMRFIIIAITTIVGLAVATPPNLRGETIDFMNASILTLVSSYERRQARQLRDG